MKKLSILLITITLLACKNDVESDRLRYLTEAIPNEIPLIFKENLIPENKIVHKGIFNPDLDQYFYVLSDKNFERFDTYVVKKTNDVWSKPQEAFFNSDYNDHGLSFSPDGNTIYFSSTRPTNIDSIPQTWHIWKSDKINGRWNEPLYVDIPNLRDKLTSHPILTDSGTLYFHSSNLDYSEMELFYSKKVDGKFRKAEKVLFETTMQNAKCTPYVSPKEDFLIFASIEDQLELMISFNDGSGKWLAPRKLNKKINEKGQGNPFITPDNKFLFFTSGEQQNTNWNVNWVNIESELINNQ